ESPPIHFVSGTVARPTAPMALTPKPRDTNPALASNKPKITQAAPPMSSKPSRMIGIHACASSGFMQAARVPRRFPVAFRPYPSAEAERPDRSPNPRLAPHGTCPQVLGRRVLRLWPPRPCPAECRCEYALVSSSLDDEVDCHIRRLVLVSR